MAGRPFWDDGSLLLRTGTHPGYLVAVSQISQGVWVPGVVPVTKGRGGRSADRWIASIVQERQSLEGVENLVGLRSRLLPEFD